MERELTGAEGRDKGMRRAYKAAPPDWKAEAELIIDSLVKRGEPFTADDVWERLDHPPEPRALGGMLRGRCARGVTVKLGIQESRRRERHCGHVTVWRAAV